MWIERYTSPKTDLNLRVFVLKVRAVISRNRWSRQVDGQTWARESVGDARLVGGWWFIGKVSVTNRINDIRAPRKREQKSGDN